MFIIEYIIKKLTKKKEKPEYNPTAMQEKDYEECEHVYMPIDSTGETLSCTKCGILCMKSELKDEMKKNNFFMQKDAEKP